MILAIYSLETFFAPWSIVPQWVQDAVVILFFGVIVCLLVWGIARFLSVFVIATLLASFFILHSSFATVVLVSNVTDIVQMPGTTNYVNVWLSGKLQITNNGTASGPIVLTSTNGTGFSRDTWGATYLTVDRTNSIIYNTDNFGVSFWRFENLVMQGTNSGQTFATTNGCQAISIQVGRDVTFSNIFVSGLSHYVGNASTNSISPNVGGILLNTGATGATNILVADSTVDDVANGMGIAIAGGYNTGIHFINVTNTRCNWGTYMLQSYASFCEDVIFDGLRNWNSTNWNGFSGGNHGDMLIISCNGPDNWTATNRNCIVRNSYFGPRVGTNQSALLYQDATHTSDAWPGTRIYNCIFDASEPGDTGFPLLAVNCVTSLVANCTFVGRGGGGIAIASANTTALPGVAWTNNLFINVGAGCGSLANWASELPRADYNLYNYTNVPLTGPIFGYDNTESGGHFTDFFGWQATLGNDLHSQFLTNHGAFTWSSGYSVSEGSPAIDAGVNLTAHGITTDIAGNARPATGPWTVGAYQVTVGDLPPPVTTYRARIKGLAVPP